MNIDPKALAQNAVTPLRDALKGALSKATPEAKALASAVKDYEDDLAVTIKALQETTDPVSAALLVEDMERFLPARRAAIVSRAANLAGSVVEDVLLSALGIAEGIAFALARSYVPALGAVDLESIAKRANDKIKEG